MEEKEIKFAFPIKKDDGKDYTLAELFEIQEKEKFGQFLLSGNNFWHGGIHFSSELHDKNKPIRAIADGKVIAYRVNKSNKISTYQDDESDLELNYSTGFCLIKHEYGVLERKGPEQIAQEKADAIYKDITDKVKNKNISLDKDNIGTYDASEYDQFLSDETSEVARKGSVKNLKLNVLEIDKTARQPPSGKGDKYYFGKAKVTEDLGEFSKDDEIYVALFKENGEVFNDLFQLPKNTVSIPNLNGDPTDNEISQLLMSINNNAVVTGASSAPQSIGNVVVTPKEQPLLNKITFYSLYVHLLAYDDFGDKERPTYWETKEEKSQTIDVSGKNVILGEGQITSQNTNTSMSLPKNTGIAPKPEPKSFDSVVSVDVEIKAGDLIGYMGVYDTLALVEREDKSDPNKQGLVIGVNKIAKKNSQKQATLQQTNNTSSQQRIDDFELDTTTNATEYTVKSGDNLSKIARNKANEANAAHDINIVPGRMMDEIRAYPGNEQVQRAPHDLKVGQVINIPAFKKKTDLVTENNDDEKVKDDDSNKESKHQAHLELFILTEDDVKKLLDNPAKLKQDRQYIKVKQSASLYIKEGEELKNSDYVRQALIAEVSKNTPEKIGELEYYSIKVDQKPYAGKSYYVNKKDVDGEIFCQHDWGKVGFEIAEGDSNSHGYLTDKQKLKIFNEIYEKIPREDNCIKLDYISQDSFRQFVFGKEEYDYYRRRIIAKHPTEWQGTQNSKFVDMLKLLTNAEYDPNKLGQLIRVVDKFTNNEINAKRANAIFDHEKERIEELAFWDDVPELSTKMPYHFHPLAFAGNIINFNILPPWLILAWQEHDKYKGVKETEEPLSSKIKEYHNTTNAKGLGGETSWCASFVNWCMIKAGYKNSYTLTALAYGWKANAWAEGEVYKSSENGGKGKAFVGAIVVFNFSHVAFVIGQTKEGLIVALGGNQGRYYLNVTKVSTSKVLCYMKPKNFTVSQELEELPILSVTGGVMSYENTR